MGDNSTHQSKCKSEKDPLYICNSSFEVNNLVDKSSSDSKSLDMLGPVVLNTDGSMSRITNWHKLTDSEKENTKRLVIVRNAKRRAVLDDAAERQE